MNKTVVSIQNLSKSFPVGTGNVEILKNITFDISEGDFLIIFGPSGCGKSTLLHTILGLEEPTTGRVIFLGEDLYALPSEDDRANIRKLHIGMIYQQPNWIKSLTVVENIVFPLLLLGQERKPSTEKAWAMLQTVEMAARTDYIPTELSSGEQQRIALARALITGAEVIIADEPTGNMDYESGQKLMQVLVDLNVKENKTIIMVTHDLEYLKFAKKAVRMFNGSIVGIYNEKNKGDLIDEIKSKRGTEEIESAIPKLVNPLVFEAKKPKI